VLFGNYFDLKHRSEVYKLLWLFKGNLDILLAIFARLSVPRREDLKHNLIRFSHQKQ